MKKITKRSFSLLEILIGISLLLAASGVLGLRWHQSIQLRKFDTSLTGFRDACQVAYRLAVTTQTDWQGTLKKGPDGWVFEVVCLEGERPCRLKPVDLKNLEITKSHACLPNPWCLIFFSSGKINPEAVLTFSNTEREKEVSVLEIVGLSEKGAIKQGPVHPQELPKNRKAAAF